MLCGNINFFFTNQNNSYFCKFVSCIYYCFENEVLYYTIGYKYMFIINNNNNNNNNTKVTRVVKKKFKNEKMIILF